DCRLPRFLGERFKEVVHDEIESLRSADQGKRTVLCDHALVWRLHVNRIRFRVRRSCYFADWHRGFLAEQIGKAARMMRIEMLHNHKRHSCSRRQMAQQFHRCFEASGGSADSDDWTMSRFFRLCCPG